MFLFRVAGVEGEAGLLFQPPAGVLPAPVDFLCGTAVCKRNPLRVGFYHHDDVPIAFSIVPDQVAGAELPPAGVVNSAPGQIPEGGVGTQRCPARAVAGDGAVRPAAGGVVGGRPSGAAGVLLSEGLQGGLYTFFRGGGWCGGEFLLVGLGAVDVDGVGDSIVGHPKIHGPADVPEFDVVVSSNVVGGHGDLLAVHVDGLAAGPGGEVVRRLGGGAAQRETGEDAKPHKNCFLCSFHDDSPFSCNVPLANTTMLEDRQEVKNNQGGGVEKNRALNEAYCTADVSPIIFCGADFTWVTWSAPSAGHR